MDNSAFGEFMSYDMRIPNTGGQLSSNSNSRKMTNTPGGTKNHGYFNPKVNYSY